MSQVRIHCYGCSATLVVPEAPSREDVERAGWSISAGETYCHDCASARGLSPSEAPTAAEPGTTSPELLEPFNVRQASSGRTIRLLRASLSLLHEDPKLIVFPTVSFIVSIALVGVFFGVSLSGGGGAQHLRNTSFIGGLIVAYPLTFVSLFCGVALACVLGERLEGKDASASDGWRAARSRTGVIAGWTLLTCTVGAVLRIVEQYLPLGGKIAAALLDLSWSLATLFAVPVLAYEGLGPRATFARSTGIFKARWGTQIKGSVGIGAGGLLMLVPSVALVVLGVAAGGSVGQLLLVLAAAAFCAAIAVLATLGQIFRVFVYRSAVGLPTAGPFDAADLQTPFSRQRRR
jgi:Family of unknown function (DUF6159)